MPTPIFRLRPNQPVSWYSTRLDQSNAHCLYCGALVGSPDGVPSNREHMVGLNFVPTGTLGSTDFNFIFRACEACNTRKSRAEGHVSAVTLFSVASQIEDEVLRALVERKASKDMHPTRRVPVKDAFTTINFTQHVAGASWTLSMAAPPQPDPDMVGLLACNQIQALFALVTSPDPRKAEHARMLAASHWHLFGYYRPADWGNPQLIEIARRTRHWPTHASILTADGNFRAILRSAPDEREGWIWALEWNKALRVVGAIGHSLEGPPAFVDLPELDWQPLPDGRSRVRTDVPLGDREDELFICERLGE